MTTVYLAPTFGAAYQGFTTGGLPLNGGLIYTYIAGGTTPQATYTTSTGGVQNANPIVLGADGRTPAEVWLTAGTAYRFDVKDSLGNLIQTYDNLYGIANPSYVGIPWAVAGGTADVITASYTPANSSLTDGLILGVRASAANATTTPTFSPDGLTAHTITKEGGIALVPGDIPRALAEILVRYNLANTRWEILNPVAFKQPTRTVLTSGSSATYTTPTLATRINVRLVGGGGGGSAQTTNNGTAGNNTTFSTITGSGGGGGVVNGIGAPGAASGGDINISGGAGQGAAGTVTAGTFIPGGQGGSSAFGGAGAGGQASANAGNAAGNSGGGGGGAGGAGAGNSGSGGGAGGYAEKLITAPAATYTYTVGASALGGAAGGAAGGSGGSGIIIVDEFYN